MDELIVKMDALLDRVKKWNTFTARFAMKGDIIEAVTLLLELAHEVKSDQLEVKGEGLEWIRS